MRNVREPPSPGRRALVVVRSRPGLRDVTGSIFDPRVCWPEIRVSRSGFSALQLASARRLSRSTYRRASSGVDAATRKPSAPPNTVRMRRRSRARPPIGGGAGGAICGFVEISTHPEHGHACERARRASRRRASWGFFYWPRRFLFYNHARSERPCPFLSRKAAFYLNGGLCYSYKIKNIKTPSIQSTLCLYHPLRLLGPGELQVVLCVKLAHPGSGRSVAGAATERAIEPPC